jgi:prepilin-type N-terminal cleavage/methylation domain-containing protein
MTTRAGADRRRHYSQRGLTLIEILVATSITAVIAVSLGVALSLSARVVGSQGVQGQQVSSGALLEAERQFGSDVDRAECVSTGGSCPAGSPSVCSGAALCVAWCDGSSVQGAAYSLDSGQLVRRDSAGNYFVVAREVQTFIPSPLPADPSIPDAVTRMGPQVQIELKAGTDRPQHDIFTARSLVTGAGACP